MAEYALTDLPARIAQKIVIDLVSGCWLWQAYRNPKGYGCTSWRGRPMLAHRLVYILLVGQIPDDRPQLDHVREKGCRHRHCCNPVHLEPVTNRENSRRGDVFHGTGTEKTHCDNGHEYTPENTRIKEGRRACKTCHCETEYARYHGVPRPHRSRS